MKRIITLSSAAVLFAVTTANAGWFQRDKYELMFKTNPVAESDESAQQGAQIYAQNCQVCHGVAGHGDGPAASSLSIRPTDLTQTNKSDGFLAAHITYGKGSVMPAWGGALSEKEIWEVVHYVNSLRSPANN